MAILNYTTKIAVEKTAAEIQKKLALAKASAVLSEYDSDGVMCAMSFRIKTAHGVLSFRLPARIDGVYKRLHTNDIPKRLRTNEQAARVAWRIIKDWIEAQLAIVEADQAELAEVFLPYLQDPKTGETAYQKLQQGGFQRLAHD